ncbi:MAG: isochorismatase family protein [Clostridiales bacterium]|nr:isochorismatase family protein [Clostridiales bacterium]
MRNYPECLLDPEQCVVAIIDHQPQMYFAVKSAFRDCVANNAAGLANAAKLFGVPCILSTIEAAAVSGPLIAKIQSVYPQTPPIDRTNLNAWEDANFKAAIEGTGRKKVILAGLWTEVCVTLPALSMMRDGYEVFVAVDASAGSCKQAHKTAISRMIQAGVTPLTWQQIMLEWQRDWNNKDTYNGVMSIAKEYGGTYGLSIEYVENMIKA